MCKRSFGIIWLCVPHVDLAAVFLAHIAAFMQSKNLLWSQLCIWQSYELFAFYTGTIFNTLIFQLRTEHFSTTILDVLEILLFVFLLFGIHRISLCKNRYPYKDNFHFICILDFYSLCKTCTRCIQKS